MTTDKGRPLPKFGQEDDRPRARDDEKTTGPGHAQAGIPPAFRDNGGAGNGVYRPDFKSSDSYQYMPPKRIKKKWFFCVPADSNSLLLLLLEKKGTVNCVPHQE
ncbi:uncharacterized protein LOC133923659 [Phragmites australis]|uniref:uncharacterized protein LOC133923659 n=1 Tax=Phragmites australis TaxID=29695 RepID=UPI002D77F415|nr:uncharacterized protein LOC133923659 [Phragmites australis]